MEEKEVALTILRGAAAGAGVTAAVSTDPLVSVIAMGSQTVLALVAKLVDQVGQGKAQDILERLIQDPADLITDADLDADVEQVRRELGL
jgi:hypothetical protein